MSGEGLTDGAFAFGCVGFMIPVEQLGPAGLWV